MAPAARHARFSRRFEIFISARLWCGRRVVRASVRNVSARGFRASASVPVKRGDKVVVDLPGIGRIPARVAWAEQGRFGAVFHRAIDIMVCVGPAVARAA